MTRLPLPGLLLLCGLSGLGYGQDDAPPPDLPPAVAADTPLPERARPWYIAHRGSALLYPENSAESFRLSRQHGVNWLETDAWLLKDGEIGLFHDNRLDRITDHTGPTDQQSAEQWRALRLDADRWLGRGYSGEASPLLFRELAARTGPASMLLVEGKNAGAVAALARQARALAMPVDRLILSSFSAAELSPAHRDGYPGLLLTGRLSLIPDFEALVRQGIRYIGFGNADTTDPALIRTAADAGLYTVAWTINRRHEARRLSAAGVDGLITDDPLYLDPSRPPVTADTWDTGRWMPGMIANIHRGEMLENGAWGYTSRVQGYRGALQGWACPTPATYRLTLELSFSGLLNDDPTRWASVFLAADDDAAFTDHPANRTGGYHVLIRGNGQMQIYAISPGQAPQLLGTQAGPPPVLNRFLTLTVQVSDDTVSLSRHDHPATLTVQDRRYRGGYFHLGRNGAAVRFRRVRLAP